MVIYSTEIQNVVNGALEELDAQHKTGKLPNSPVSNTHFLVRWVTLSLKKQRFDRCVKDDLVRWQKSGRSKGTNSALEFNFRNISKFYAKLLPLEQPAKSITDADIESFMTLLEKEEWGVSTEFELTEKIQVFTEGENSFLLCSKQCDDCFDGGSELVKPMSFFVRGHHAEFVRLASEFGFMLHKRTDYKSVVKYHGEYLIYPKNQGVQLAEIPIGF